MERVARSDLGTWIALIVAIAALYLAADLLMPLALAGLVAFAISPLVEWLERGPLGRVPAVIGALLTIGLFIGGIGWIVGREAASLAEQAPQYRSILREKVRDLRGPIGSLSETADELSKLGAEIEQRAKPASKVAVVEQQGVLDTASALLTPLLGPLGTAGLVIVLALFLLLEREELRDRMIWLTGARDLSLTTNALDDAARRVSRYLGMQSLVCAIHGVAVAVGLLAIGVPGAVLWGALSALLRFVPYFGPWIAAALPIALSFAAFHGWTQPLLTLGLFVGLELVSNNVLEPWLYGSSVGLSPFGVVFSAVFWTWLWGIPGLVIATPLTVCLVVAGRYVHALRYFPVLLGDQPALPPDVRLYQRLLALDLDEAALVLREALAKCSIEEVSDRVVLPVIRRLAEDDQRDAFTDAKTDEVRERLAELLSESLGDEVAADANPEGMRAEGMRAEGVRVLFVPALDENDALAGRWMARICATRGVAAAFASHDSLASEIVERIGKDRPEAVCISALSPRALAHARHLCKRIAATPDGPSVIVGAWAAPTHVASEAASNEARITRISETPQLQSALSTLRALGSAPLTS
jgi:predicted PurR-regulated permease PerM